MKFTILYNVWGKISTEWSVTGWNVENIAIIELVPWVIYVHYYNKKLETKVSNFSMIYNK